MDWLLTYGSHTQVGLLVFDMNSKVPLGRSKTVDLPKVWEISIVIVTSMEN